MNSPISTVAWREAGFVYYPLSFFYQLKFGSKVRKISLDAGFDCPNRDGKVGRGGCIFCNPASFSPSRRTFFPSLTAQIDNYIHQRGGADNIYGYIAYFQPSTNTYAPVERLREVYEEALRHPRIVGISIGTRPDCVPEGVLDLLEEIASKTFMVVEFGLQTIHDRSLDWLKRGHNFAAFEDAYGRCRQRGLKVGVHLIVGLPGESREDILTTGQTLAQYKLHSLKLHNLYAVKDTFLGEMVQKGEIRLPGMVEYVMGVVDLLEETPPNVIVERLSGDAPPEYLLGPEWCVRKAEIRRAVEQEFHRRGSYQGIRCSPLLFAESHG
jgi:uncharacterized protein